MKKLLLLLLLIPLVSFGQDEVTVVQSKTSISSETNIENELVLSDEKTTIKTPLIADLSNYTHLLLVKVNLKLDNKGFPKSKFTDELFSNYKSHMSKLAYEPVKNLLEMGVFEIVNPYVFDSKRFKKEPLYLKSIKKESYLYLYLIQSQGKGDDINTTFIIRDWKNKQIYNATHINTGLNEILAPLIDY